VLKMEPEKGSVFFLSFNSRIVNPLFRRVQYRATLVLLRMCTEEILSLLDVILQR